MHGQNHTKTVYLFSLSSISLWSRYLSKSK